MSSRVIRNNRFWENVDVWGSPVIANMLWICLSMLLITLPLGLVGLFATSFHWVDSRRTQVFSIFLGTIRAVWHKAYLLFLLDVSFMAFIGLNLLIVQQMQTDDVFKVLSASATLFTAVMFVLVNIPIWVLVATWDAPLSQIVAFALRLAFAEPLGVLLIAVGFVFPFGISLYLPAVVLVFLTGTVASVIACWGTYRLVYKYIAREDFRLIKLV